MAREIVPMTKLVFAAIALGVCAGGVLAETYPNRPVKIIQGFAPGGNADAIARILGQEMAKTLGQPILVEAKPGAGGIIAADFVAKAAPDGYTLLLVTGGHAVAGATYASLPFDPVKDFDMISTITFVQFVIVVRSDSKLQSMPALLALAKSAPESVSYGSAGVGSTQHLAGELLGVMAHVKLMHVPYKGDALAITGLLGGEIQCVIAPATALLAQLKAGKIRALAVTGRTRMPTLPDIPTVDESGVTGFDVRPYLGLATSTGTPRPILERLHAEIQRALQVPLVRARLEEIGGEVSASTPEEMRSRVASDLERWVNVIKAGNIPRQ
jgi:tripartite-type tricarboxylate transporter receptor subunit TctC